MSYKPNGADLPPTVSAIGSMNFEGNIIPHGWYKMVIFDNGKPDLNAIVILAEVVYWYRPTIERDERTGAVISIRKKFKADMLQRSYQSFADQFGLTRRQVEDAVARLDRNGFIYKETRTVDTPQGRLSHVLFLAPIPDAIHRISIYDETYMLIPPIVDAGTTRGMTDTEITSEINTEKGEFDLIWERVLHSLASGLPATTYNVFVGPSKLIGIDNGIATIQIGDAKAKDWFENRLTAQIKRALKQETGRAIAKILITIKE
jgi:hypothetical protein